MACSVKAPFDGTKGDKSEKGGSEVNGMMGRRQASHIAKREAKDNKKNTQDSQGESKQSLDASEQHFLVFQLLYMIGFVVHCRKYDDIYFPLMIAHVAAHVLLPCRDLVFGSGLVVILRCFFDYTPHCANHHNVITLTSLVLLPQQVARILGRDSWTQEALACLRYLVFLLYFMAGFHKINHDFMLEPTVTCAFKKVEDYFIPLFGPDFQDRLPAWLGYSLPAGVIVLEMVPPILFMYPQWRRLGMLLIIQLHAILLPMGFADFGSIAQSFLWTFASPDLLVDSGLVTFFKHMAMVMVGFESTVFLRRLQQNQFRKSFFRREEELLVFLVYGYMWFHMYRTKERKPIQVRFPRSVGSWLILSLFLFFILNPYMGLRTVGNLTMFSNLRTDGPTSNHLLLGSNPLKFYSMQEDTVEIIACEDSFADDPKPTIVAGHKVQRLVFDRHMVIEATWAEEYPNVYLKIQYQGEILETFDLNNDPAFDRFRLDNEPWWSAMYFNFRSVPVSSEPSRCRW